MSATKWLTLRHRGPAQSGQTLGQAWQFHQKTMARNINRAAYIRRGSPMMGDPSWLSQFIKHNSKIVKGVVDVVGGALAPITGGASLLGAGIVNSVIGAPNLPAPLRPGATAPLGGGSQLGALAPAMPLTMGNFPVGIASPIPDPTGGSTPEQQNPGGVVAIPSSGGGTMLYHHFFGTSKSRAIPVNQTNGIRPRGYHVNKHGYYLKEIATWIEPGSVYVPGRRRNPLNPRALHRGIARLISAKHAVRKLGLLDVPRRHHVRRRSVPAFRKPRQLRAG